jgi:arylsulfatase
LATTAYNLAGLKQFTIASTQALSPGTHNVRMEFAYDGGGLAKIRGIMKYQLVL